MAHPVVILITGAPCTGKTSLGQRLAHDLHYPFVSKDAIKEQLFDHLGWEDRAWSRKLSQASFELLYYWCTAQVQAGQSLIIEANFKPQHATPRLRELKAAHEFALIQLLLTADKDVVLERFRQRTGQRHPGHVDEVYLPELTRSLEQEVYQCLAVDGVCIELDMTDFSAFNYNALLDKLALG